jgi:2-oxoglutarate ferredoxin oxidoreductase subunit alpha
MLQSTQGILEGVQFINGDNACAEGTICAGCRFAAGYPITPSTEIVEHLARRFPLVGGLFVQMEDEIASSIAIIGAAWGGAKAMTVTSGPGMSLMMEHIGFAAMTETPCVFVNVQRGGPSTGLPTLPAQADVMQARWGSHGDYQIIALAPSSPQEAFDLTIRAFNLAEQFRTPVILLMDEAVGHMLERVVIPPLSRIEITERRYTKKKPGEYLPYEVTEDLVPPMAPVGHGYRYHMTGLTHDERGYPVMSAECQDRLLGRLRRKILAYEEKGMAEVEIKSDDGGKYPVLVISYGITTRIAQRAVEDAGEGGIRAGHLQLRTIWPFPEKAIRKVIGERGVKAVVVPEINLGQLVLEVERVAGCDAKVHHVPHAGGSVHEPERISAVIESAYREVHG